MSTPGRRRGNSPQTYAEIVKKYRAEDHKRGDRSLQWYADQADFETRLRIAVLSRTCEDKRHAHQRRISEALLQAAHRALAQCDLESCRTFEELHGLIERITSRIVGIGPLAVYDFACRIGSGARPRLLPKKVYLHSGTRVGAKALGLGHGLKTIEIRDLPQEFHCLSGRHAEDCLCTYKDELKQIASRSKR